MDRRGFIGSLLATATLDPERLLWRPKLISIPKPRSISFHQEYPTTAEEAFISKTVIIDNPRFISVLNSSEFEVVLKHKGTLLTLRPGATLDFAN